MTDVEIAPNFTGFNNAKYAFTLFPTRRITNTDTIEIRFAQQILLQDGNPVCSISSLSDASLKLTSCISIGNAIFIKTTSTAANVSDFIVTIRIESLIQNPFSVYNDPTVVNIKEQNGNIRDSNTNLIFTYAPAQISTLTIDNLNKNPGEITDLVFKFTPVFPVPLGASIRLDFPYFNENSGAPVNQVFSMLMSINGGTSVTYITGLNPTLNFKANYSSSQLFLFSINNPSSFISGECSFKVSNVLNPLSLRGKSGFTLSFLDQNSNLIQQSAPLSIKPSTNSDVTNLSIIESSSAVSRMANFNFVFQTRNYKGRDFMIEIIFPSEFSNLDKNQIKINGISKLNMNGFLDFDLTTINKIRILNPFNQYYVATDIHNLRVANIRNPYTTKKTASFAFNVYDSSGSDLIYSLKREVSLTPSAGVFVENVVKPLNLSVNKQTSYAFLFLTDSFILKSSSLVIAFPPEIILLPNTDGSCNLSDFSGVIIGTNANTDSIKCAVTLDNKAVITNLFQADFLQTQNKFGLTVANIKNPSYDNDWFLFSISLNAADGNTIDFYTGNVLINYANGVINCDAFSNENKNVNTMNTLSLDLSLQDDISGDSRITIELPGEFRFLDDLIGKAEFSAFRFDASLNNYDTQKPILLTLSSINNNNNNINNIPSNIFNLDFKKENFTITSNAKIRIQIKNIINPRPNKPLQITNIRSFTLINQNNVSTAYAVDSLVNPIKIENFEVPENTQFTMLPRESVTGKLTSYILSVKPLSRLYSGDSLILKLPSAIQLTQNTNVSGSSPNLDAKLDFDISSITAENLDIFSVLKIALSVNTSAANKNFISESESLSISLNSIINPYSTEPLEIPQIQIFTSENFLVENSTKKLMFSVETPNLIQNPSIKPVQSFIGGASDYLIEFTTSNKIFKDSQIKIFYPKEITIVDSKCTGLQGIQVDLVCLDDPSSRIFIVKNGFQKEQQANTIKLKIAQIKNNLKAPQIKTDTFKIAIETKSGYITDAVLSNLNLTFYCNFPCKSCLQDTVTCLACESAQGQILYNGTCVSKCPSGTYYSYNSDQDKNQCRKCSENCSSCAADNPNICTSCPADKPLFILESNSCVNKCPDGFYADLNNKQCFKCDPNCKTCANSKTSCLSCERGLALYEREARCVADCPQNISILIRPENSINTKDVTSTDKCVSCDVSCSTCKDLIGNCLSCGVGFAFFKGKCLPERECPQGTIALGGKCTFCDDKCEICRESSDLSLCRKCKDAFVLGADFKCYIPVNSCEKSFYNKEGVCYQCDLDCESCSLEAGLCTSCAQGMLLQGRKCLVNCEEGFYKKSERECSKCDSACKACFGRADNCLQCIKGMKLFITKNVSACVNACPDGFFPNGLIAKTRKLMSLEFSSAELDFRVKAFTENKVIAINLIENSALVIPQIRKFLIAKKQKLNSDNLRSLNSQGTQNTFNSESSNNLNNPSSNDNNNNPNNNLTSKTECSSCIKNCRVCSDSLSCLRCELGFYLYNKSKCLKFCPDNYFENSQNAQCELVPDSKVVLLLDGTYSKKLSNPSGKTATNLYGVINNNYMCKNCDYTYTFLVVFMLGFFLVLFLKCVHNEIHFLGSILGFSSVFIFSFNIYLVKIIFNFGIRYLFYLTLIKLFVNYLLNYTFVLRLSFLIKPVDNQFSYWSLNNKITMLFYVLAGLFLDYKIIRLLYSRFKVFKNTNSLGCLFCFENFFNAKFADVENINKPFKQMLIADILLTDSLVILICLFVFFNFYFSSEILKLSITVFAIHLILLFIKIGEIIVFIAADDFYNQRKITAVDVKPYISCDKNAENNLNNSESRSQSEKINKRKLSNFDNKNEQFKNKFLSEENNLKDEKAAEQNDDNSNNLGFYTKKIASNSKNKNNFRIRNLKMHNSVCFDNENNIGGLNLNLNIVENPEKQRSCAGKYAKQIVNSGDYNKNEYDNYEDNYWYKNRLNNSGGIYELEKYANCNLSKEFGLNYNNTNTANNNNENKEAENISCSARRDFECKDQSESNGNCFNYSDFDRKCKSLFTKRNHDNEFNLNSDSGNDREKYYYYYNNYNNQDYDENNKYDYNDFIRDQNEINFNNNNYRNKEVNAFVNSQQSENNSNNNSLVYREQMQSQKSSKIKGAYADKPRRHTFSRLSFHKKNPPADKNSEENKDQYSSYNYSINNNKYAVNDEKAIQDFNNFNNNNNQANLKAKERESSSQNNSNNKSKTGFFKKLTSSIKNIFPSTKKAQKHQYCVVQDENQVSCFNNRKINTFKSRGVGLSDRLADTSIECKDKNMEKDINKELEREIESTPNFNTNRSYGYNNYSNTNNNFCFYNPSNYEQQNSYSSNVWGLNEVRGPSDNFSVSQRTNTADLSDIDLLKRKN